MTTPEEAMLGIGAWPEPTERVLVWVRGETLHELFASHPHWNPDGLILDRIPADNHAAAVAEFVAFMQDGG